MVMNAISAMKKTKQQLHEAGFKLTPQREATLLVLLENEKEHLSAEEIFFLVKKKSPEIGLATVYRTLEILTELKIVDKVSFNDFILILKGFTKIKQKEIELIYFNFCSSSNERPVYLETTSKSTLS